MTLHDALMPTRRQIACFFGAGTLTSLCTGTVPPVTVGWQELAIETPDGPLAYARAGTGPLLVLLPGGPGGSGWGLRHWATPLTDRLTVVILDPIGRGRSARLADPRRYTLERDVSDVERLRQHLGLEQLTVYGHSYGGLMAQAWALTCPERVRGLILGNTTHGSRDWQAQLERCKTQVQFQHPELWVRWLDERARGLRSDRAEFDALLGPCLEPLYWHNPELRSRKPPVSPQPGRDRLNREVYLAMLGNDPEWQIGGTLAGVELLAQLSRVQAPALVFSGRSDRICPPASARDLAAALPHAQGQLFEHSGHRPFIEEPEAWAQRVGHFVRELT